MPGQDRQMIQGVYRRHLSIMVLSNFPEHLGEIVGLLLILTECHAVETCLWFDVIDALLAQHKKVDSRYYSKLLLVTYSIFMLLCTVKASSVKKPFEGEIVTS